MLPCTALPPGLAVAGPQGVSGPCELTLRNQQQLHGRLDQFHDGDRALDLRLARQRWPLSLPLREVQWLRMREPAQAGAVGEAAVPVRLCGPATPAIPGWCLRSRLVPGGVWLDLLDARGQVHRWFVHDLPQVQLSIEPG